MLCFSYKFLLDQVFFANFSALVHFFNVQPLSEVLSLYYVETEDGAL
jgi:hypothetical protein